MPKQGEKLISALEAVARAHQQLVNIGNELRTVQMARQRPDEDEMRRFHQAYYALVEAAMSVHTVVCAEQAISCKKAA